MPHNRPSQVSLYSGHGWIIPFYASQQKRLQQLLYELRQEAGLRQIDLAKRLGVPQSFVSKYESGERRLDVLELRAVCVALKISLKQFVRRLEEALSDLSPQ